MQVTSEYIKEALSVEHVRNDHPHMEDFSMHAHNVNEILYFLSGDATYMVEGNEYKLIPGCVMLMMHGETHMLRLKSNAPYERIVLHFADNFWEYDNICAELLKPFLDKPLGSYNYFEPDKAFKTYMTACAAKPSDNDRLNELNLKSNLLSILQLLRKKYISKEQSVFSGSNSNVRNIIEYINENLFSDMSLDSICAAFFVNKSQLNRDFKELTGSTVWDYIIIKRLLKAKEMIQNGVKTNLAAETVGFHDYSNFYRSYKAHFNISPKDDSRR